jgi:hypothetical protein
MSQLVTLKKGLSKVTCWPASAGPFLRDGYVIVDGPAPAPSTKKITTALATKPATTSRKIPSMPQANNTRAQLAATQAVQAAAVLVAERRVASERQMGVPVARYRCTVTRPGGSTSFGVALTETEIALLTVKEGAVVTKGARC